MDQDERPSFSSKDEEIDYWKSLAEKFCEEKNEIQKELEDYTEDSTQLEKELETSLAQAEKRNKELQLVQNKILNELESLKDKLEHSQHEILKLETDVESLNNEKIQMQIYIRELEQKNDDLERAERVVAESVAAVEASLNLAIERNAILESEVDEKETLKEKLQRLVDETRDLKQELKVKERLPDNERVLNGDISPIDSNKIREIERLKEEIKNMPATPTSAKREPFNSKDHLHQPMRTLALNLVNEILKKIGKLEAKIAAQRENERRLQSADPYRTQRRFTRDSTSPSKRLSTTIGN